jgi:hypothetical protein
MQEASSVKVYNAMPLLILLYGGEIQTHKKKGYKQIGIN